MDPRIDKLAVELVPHRAEWAGMARAETARLGGALGGVLVAVHHIGSTSIPDIMAKPIVDMIPIATSLAGLDAKEEAIRALGYRWYGEFGLPGRRYCTLTDPVTGKRRFQLHCYAEGDPGVRRHLAFRDYLRAHPGIARAYEAEKLRAAALRPDDTLAYNAEKNDWIKRVEADALAWWASRPAPPAP
ncbi:MAG TPA: GrpB family protein [Rhizomicrobium sp.]|nr:GrpB family protein [Rhizomicrobium sp.]